MESWTRNPDQIGGGGYQRQFPLNYLCTGKTLKYLTKSKPSRAPCKSRKPAKSTESSDQLRRFPPEIRTIIFRYVLDPRPEESTIISGLENPARYYPLEPDFKLPSFHSPQFRCGSLNVRLLETCKWIHAEAAALLYRETRFQFEKYSDCGAFVATISQKYRDRIKHVKITKQTFIPNLRNLKTLSIPIYACTYKDARDAKKNGFLMEELTEVRELLLLRGLTSIVIEDPNEIGKRHPELAATKKKLDMLIINTVKLPRKFHGGTTSVSMDCFVETPTGRIQWPGHSL